MKLKDGFSGERSIVLPKLILDMMEQDPLLSTLRITDIGYYPHAAHHYRERHLPLGQYVFIYCVDGRGHFTVNGKRHDVSPNQYFILPPDKPHSYGADDTDPWTIYWIHFGGTLAMHYAVGAGTPCSVDPGRHSRIENRINLFEEIFNTLNAGFSIENMHYAMSLFHHYLGSLRYLQQYRDARTPGNENDIVDATIHYLNENIERHLTLDDIASYAGLSPSHLSTVFKQRTGHSAISYFNLLKVRRACSLIDDTTMKLNQICYKLGINDPYYFSRMFTKIMGMSPRAYRNRARI